MSQAFRPRASRQERGAGHSGHDWSHYERFCEVQGIEPLPDTTALGAMNLARFLDGLARQGKKLSTIERAAADISKCFERAGLARPVMHPLVRAMLDAIRYLN